MTLLLTTNEVKLSIPALNRRSARPATKKSNVTRAVAGFRAFFRIGPSYGMTGNWDIEIRGPADHDVWPATIGRRARATGAVQPLRGATDAPSTI